MLGATWPGVEFPGHRKQYKFGEGYFDMKKFFDANYDKFEIFVYTNLNKDDTTWMEDYELWQHAIASKIVRKRTQFNPEAWFNQTISGLPFVCHKSIGRFHSLPTYIMKTSTRFWTQ